MFQKIISLDPGFALAIVFHILLFVIGTYDLWIVFSHGEALTVSEYVRLWSGKYPVVSFAAGFLCGHLFFAGVRP